MVTMWIGGSVANVLMHGAEPRNVQLALQVTC